MDSSRLRTGYNEAVMKCPLEAAGILPVVMPYGDQRLLQESPRSLLS